MFVLLVNWSPLPKNLAVQQYVTEILKIKGKKKGFLCKTCMKPHVSSVNMNRVIQTENPPKMVPRLRLFFEFIYIQYPFYKYLGKKKGREKTGHQEVERNYPGNSCSSLFCGNVRFKKKKANFNFRGLIFGRDYVPLP